jgi:hypothetical protein
MEPSLPDSRRASTTDEPPSAHAAQGKARAGGAAQRGKGAAGAQRKPGRPAQQGGGAPAAAGAVPAGGEECGHRTAESVASEAGAGGADGSCDSEGSEGGKRADGDGGGASTRGEGEAHVGRNTAAAAGCKAAAAVPTANGMRPQPGPRRTVSSSRNAQGADAAADAAGRRRSTLEEVSEGAEGDGPSASAHASGKRGAPPGRRVSRQAADAAGGGAAGGRGAGLALPLGKLARGGEGASSGGELSEEGRMPPLSSARLRQVRGGGWWWGLVARFWRRLRACSSLAARFVQLTPPHSTPVTPQDEDGFSDFDVDPSSGGSTPHVHRPSGGRKLSRAGAAGGAANAGVAGRHSLREALRSQVAKAKRGGAAGRFSCSGGGSGGGDEGGGEAAARGGSDCGSGSQAGAAPEQEQPPPQAKLGRLPKNARLIEAMAQHRNAKPKPKGWLLAVVDSIYKEGEGAGVGGWRCWGASLGQVAAPCCLVCSRPTRPAFQRGRARTPQARRCCASWGASTWCASRACPRSCLPTSTTSEGPGATRGRSPSAPKPPGASE